MPIVQTIIERPRLRRWFSVDQFADPLRCLRDEHACFRVALGMLENLAEDLAAADRDECAAGLLDYLSVDLVIHAGDVEALIDLLEARIGRNRAVRAAGEQLREQQKAMRYLLPSVTDGLAALSKDALPPSPHIFVVSALIFAEFLRLTIAYEQSSVLTLAEARLTRQDLRNLGHDMAFRRGMGPEQ